MSGGGGSKKTTQKQEFKLPAWYEDAAKEMLTFGKNAASGGYIPYIGADVAALSPAAKAGMQGADAMSAAFGMPTSGGASYLPEEQTFAGGVKGYSSFPGFEQSMDALKNKYPGAYEFLSNFNRLGTGQSANPGQATPFQDSLAPQFNGFMSLFGGNNAGPTPANTGPSMPSGPGGKGMPDIMKMMMKGM